MRRPRMIAPKFLENAYYHCVSRVVNRDFVLGEVEKEQFIEFMRIYERLYGLRIISYCIMSNHFHILVEVPQRPPDDELPDDAGLVSHVRACLGERQADALEWELGHLRKMNAGNAVENLRESWFSRMWNVSAFMKVLKQRFTQWFNGRHRRKGTLWEDRFRSVLVEGEWRALQTMTSYIELNPVRAHLCSDPKDYRWCSYAEAVAGGKEAREALQWLVGLANLRVKAEEGTRPRNTRQKPEAAHASNTGSSTPAASAAVPIETAAACSNSENPAAESPGSSWTAARPIRAARQVVEMMEALRVWRCELFGLPWSEASQIAELAKGPDGAEIWKRRLPREKALEVLAAGGRLSKADFIRCRVRYFTDGAAIGTKGFVEGIFHHCRAWFSEKRKDGARLVKGMELVKKPDRLYALRNLGRVGG